MMKINFLSTCINVNSRFKEGRNVFCAVSCLEYVRVQNIIICTHWLDGILRHACKQPDDQICCRLVDCINLKIAYHSDEGLLTVNWSIQEVRRNVKSHGDENSNTNIFRLVGFVLKRRSPLARLVSGLL